MTATILTGCCLSILAGLPTASINCCITSPPYWGLRDYQNPDQLGLESTPDAYVENMVKVFREVRRVLKEDGTLFLNLGDSYFSGSGRARGRGIDGKAGSDCSDHDSSSRNQNGVRRGAALPHIHGNSFHHDRAQALLSLTRSREHMESLLCHLPSGDFVPPPLTRQSSTAILDSVHNSILAVEQLHASLTSMPHESFPPPPAFQKPGDLLLACLSSLRSFVSCVHRLDDMSDASSRIARYTTGSVSPCEELEQSTRCTSGYCSLVSFWLSQGDIEPDRYTCQTLKPKDLVGIPWRVAFALQADGWWLRQDIIWSKPNPMPESVRDRCTKAHEYIFLLSKSDRYYFDQDAIAEPLAASSIARLSQANLTNQEGSDRVPGKTNGTMKAVVRSGNKERKTGAERGCPERTDSNVCGSIPWEGTTRNKRSVWTVSTEKFNEAHFATFPTKLIEPCVLAGCPIGGTILDPFFGAGTTGLVTQKHGRNCIGIELNPDYVEIARKRVEEAGRQPDLFGGAA